MSANALLRHSKLSKWRDSSQTLNTFSNLATSKTAVDHLCHPLAIKAPRLNTKANTPPSNPAAWSILSRTARCLPTETIQTHPTASKAKLSTLNNLRVAITSLMKLLFMHNDTPGGSGGGNGRHGLSNEKTTGMSDTALISTLQLVRQSLMRDGPHASCIPRQQMGELCIFLSCIQHTHNIRREWR